MKNLDVYHVVSVMNPEGLTFKELTEKVKKSELYEKVILNEFNLLRNSFTSGKTYSYETKNDKRFIYREGKYFPNFDYFQRHAENLNDIINKIDIDILKSKQKYDGYCDLTTDTKFLAQILDKSKWENIEKNVSIGINNYVRCLNDEGLSKDEMSKETSELIGKLIAKKMEDEFSFVKRGKNNDDPDIIINNVLKGEIKVSKLGLKGAVTWRGGKYSKRFGSFFFITWDWHKDGNIKMNVFFTTVTEKEWKMKIRENYYAPLIPIDRLIKTFNPVIILGSIVKTKRDLFRAQFEY